jgi:hypothetical protein
MMYKYFLIFLLGASCNKKSTTETAVSQPMPPKSLFVQSATINSNSLSSVPYNINTTPTININFSTPLMQSSVSTAVRLSTVAGISVTVTTIFPNDSTMVIQPITPLTNLTKYNISISTTLKSKENIGLNAAYLQSFITQIDSSRKFPTITDNALLDLVQQQTLKYFYEFGHPISGLARERNTSGDVVTSGGSGFGVMALITGASRNFITRAQTLTRLQTMVSFLKNTAQTFHGAYPHWLNGATGAVVPFSANDNGADIVETAYLVEGLLCARQYFNAATANEVNLRSDINFIVDRVEWDWFRQGTQNVLYWHWSPTAGFVINQQIKGWNETLMTYILAKASTTHSIPNIVYTNGWASNGNNGFLNGNSFYGLLLPLGPSYGGPLFFEHYSFLGINPNGLNDVYTNYATQTKNHTLINYNYCKANPQNYFGYSDSCWGLTASDIPNGYTASSPTNDVGVIAPTAALASFPYTPTESMKALKFYYYVLGDKLWKQYGFVDAFKLQDLWFADSFLAIDQGPIIVHIENYRSGLMWNLFTSCPEVKASMLSLGFTAPYL